MAQQRPLETLRVSSFRGMQNLPLLVAQREGYFAHNRLAVDLTYTTGSAAQMAGLAHGAGDLVQTAPDNVINFDTAPQAFGVDPGTAPRALMLLGGSNGPLTVFARAGVRDVSALRGATLGVDNPSSGFALVLRDLLAHAGLELGRDYTFTVAGGTDVRCEDLLAGRIAATILYLPFDLRAAAAGCLAIDNSRERYPAYASSVTAALQSWLAEHGETATAYIMAMLRALAWIHDPANAMAVQQLMRTVPDLGLDERLIPAAYAALTDPRQGIGRTGELDDAGLRQVIALRARYGAPGVRLGEPADYWELGPYQTAVVRYQL
jgi:ABC-type nitrate/sulfonate/bicarbonate transport system substrate-binding protein